jgi:chromosome segregation ATPase
MYIVCTLYIVRGSGMTDDTERLVAEIPSELKELVDADRRTNKEIVEAALWREFGGERKGALQRRVEEKRRRISMIETEKNERQRELEEERQALDALESKLEATQTEREMMLSEAREQLADTPKDAENPAVKNWAEKLDMTPEALLEEL